jgi:predicted nucleic acid-binding protein
MEAADTSVLVRYLVQDDPDKGAAAARVLDGDQEVAVSLVAIAETAFVLAHHYAVPRDLIVDRLVELIQKQNIHLLGIDKALAASVLLLCRGSTRVSFADALINADARHHGLQRLHTFDERFPAEGLVLVAPT